MKITRFVHMGHSGIAPTASLRDAAKAMRLRRLSCLPVVRGEVVVGVITERDLVIALAITDRAGTALVNHFMKAAVLGSPMDEIPGAVAKMLALGCVDLPVLDGGRLVGMVSAHELLAAEARAEGVLV